MLLGFSEIAGKQNLNFTMHAMEETNDFAHSRSELDYFHSPDFTHPGGKSSWCLPHFEEQVPSALN